MRKKSNLVYGVGINDSGSPVSSYATIAGIKNIIWLCPFYETWRRMIGRCYSVKSHAKSPTYIGCYVDPEWHSFSAFREWMQSQPWEGNQLDKDILLPGNKVYGPDTCVFVSSKLNLFMTGSGASRGEWPIGVNWNKAAGKFRARCRNPFSGGHEFLGLFTDPSEAHEAWHQRKHELSCMYADQQTDPRIASALRARYTKGGAS